MCNKLFLLVSLLVVMCFGTVSAQKKLTGEEARLETQKQVKTFMQETREKYRSMWLEGVFRCDTLQMPILYRTFGESPAEGRSLYISMHGGGNAPKALNDQQWKNQIYLYTPKEGVYIAPRAPFDDWNMWFRPQMDQFFEMLILAAVAEFNVNPDKVYLLGYSAGGDGVWRMAPRMADRWAAASMMAGHPGEASQLNLRNLPFMIWMGELDGAYNRNTLAVQKGKVLDSLQLADKDGYVHETHIIQGSGHWMNCVDTAAIAWMAQYRRNPYPERVVWRQEETVRGSMYWLAVDKAEARPGMELIASKEGNVITVERSDYPEFVICLNDDMMDLDKPVTVKYKGKVLFRGKVKRDASVISRTLQEGGDPRLVFSAEVKIELPSGK